MQAFSWALCRPKFHKDKTPVLTKAGAHYYEQFSWHATPEQALRRLFDMLLGDALADRAADVDALREELLSISNVGIDPQKGVTSGPYELD